MFTSLRQDSRGRRLALALVVLTACVGAYAVGIRAGKDNLAGQNRPSDHGERHEKIIAGLVVPDASLNVGEVWEDDGFSCTLPIWNPTRNEIVVRDFETSCACIGVDPTFVAIPANSTVEVAVSADLTKRAP